MEQQTNIVQPQQAELTDDVQTKIVNFVLEAEKKGREARKKYQDDWSECLRLYNCEPDPVTDPQMAEFTNLVLPWAYDAVESAYSYMHSAMIPRNDKIFNFEGRTNEDHPGVEVMEQYTQQVMERARLSDQFGRALRQLLQKNHTCVKTFWKTDIHVGYEWQVGPDGVERRLPVEDKSYNGVWFDVVDIDNFVFYPCHGDINKATRIHVTFRFLEELKTDAQSGNSPYFNIDKLTSADEEREKPWDEDKDKKTYQGVKLKEAWIHRLKIGDKVYNNYIATIAADKTLVRFQPNPYPGGESPFIWIPLMPDGDSNLGYGFLSRGKQILKAATLLFNMRLDEEKVKLHKPHVFWDDSVFNPYNVITRPGAMIQMSQDSVQGGNLRPLMDDLSHLALSFQEVAELKAEFESVTVPKVVKGLLEAGNRTATEIQGASNNASGKMHTLGFYINENLLKPLIERVYLLLHTKIAKEKDQDVIVDFARCTQEATTQEQDPQTGQVFQVPLPVEEMVAKLPEVLPLPEVDVKVIGYQNSVRKEETLMALAQITPQMVDSPMGPYLKWDAMAEVIFENADLDKARLLKDAEERAAVDQQNQQMQEQQIQAQQAQLQMQMQMQAQQIELERFKEEAKAANDQQNTALKELELELKYGLEAIKQEREAINGQEGADSGGNSSKTANKKPDGK